MPVPRKHFHKRSTPVSGDSTAYISLGSNLDDGPANLQQAVTLIVNLPGITYVACSRVYTTEPQDLADQPWFSNQVIKVVCDSRWSPHMLLQALLDIEVRMGRKRKQRFGPRIIDLDLLLFDQVQVSDQVLTLPHPRMQVRAFVLIPLLELDADLVIPGGPPVAEALKQLAYEVQESTIHQA